MGSKLSRAARPQVKAVSSSVATAQNHDTDHANARSDRQEPISQLADPFSYDDIIVAASITTAAIPPRRNSAPEITSAAPTASTTMDHARERLDSFSLFLAAHQLMSIEYAGTDPDAAPAIAMAPPAPPAPPAVPFQESDTQCLICCTYLPDTRDPKHAKEVVRPCRECNNAYCGPCIKRMFTECCKDTSRMPPSCCSQIQPHYAKPHLTKDEFAEYKSKYEEWLTPNPFYCPMPRCSAFIPERLLPETATKNKERRVDSVIGTPTSKTIACPTCQVDICPDCRQVAHPKSLCNISDFGIDARTTELLKSWGYKKCPKCGHGLKRMFGCNHLECRCGAHFCYACMRDYETCNQGCADDYDEDDYSDDDVPDTDGAPALVDESSQTPGATHETAIATPLPASEPRNLDGGGHRYWVEQNLFFGEEPTENFQDRSWNCKHSFKPHTTTIAKALTVDASTEMECVKCWCLVHPEIKTPMTALNPEDKVKTVPAGARGATGGVARGVDARGRGRAPGRYLPPRGLFQADGTIGTAPHLTTAIFSPLSQSLPTREPSPMEDVQYSSDRVVDTYGNIIATSEIGLQRRASEAFHLEDPAASDTFRTPSSVFSGPTTKFSFAYECRYCDLLVCNSCKDGLTAAEDA